jgi:hypothetical protein
MALGCRHAELAVLMSVVATVHVGPASPPPRMSCLSLFFRSPLKVSPTCRWNLRGGCDNSVVEGAHGPSSSTATHHSQRSQSQGLSGCNGDAIVLREGEPDVCGAHRGNDIGDPARASCDGKNQPATVCPTPDKVAKSDGNEEKDHAASLPRAREQTCPPSEQNWHRRPTKEGLQQL